MQFRCYSCSLVFHDGPPPMEALSIAQLGAVCGRPTVQHDLLWGTPYEGMSTGNFCAFCLVMIEQFPDAQFNKGGTPGHNMVFTQGNWDEGENWHGVQCECAGFISMNKPEGGWTNQSSVLRNRWMTRHLVDVFYPDADTTEINTLMEVWV